MRRDWSGCGTALVTPGAARRVRGRRGWFSMRDVLGPRG